MLSPKTGRPKIATPKNVGVHIRFTQDTNKKLLDYAKENNITRVEVIRRAVDLFLSQH